MPARILWTLGSLVFLGFFSTQPALAQQETRVPVRMAQYPSLSPDGRRMVFDWKEDVWIANSAGGRARRVTQGDGLDTRGLFSPDGKSLVFTSNRSGVYQVYVVPTVGGVPQQVTFHTEGAFAMDWYPDGESILVRGIRDQPGRYPYRFFRVALDAVADDQRPTPVMLFDADGVDASLSPDGKRLLFTREGMDLYRKGYHGSRASQVWLASALEKPESRFRRLSPVALDTGARSPLWKADGSGYFYLGAHGESRVFEVRETDFSAKPENDRALTESDGSFPVLRPKLSADGSMLVYQRGFDLFRLELGQDGGNKPTPKKISLWVGDDGADNANEREMRRILSKADNLSFSSDGLEVAFIAGGDLWIMDTVLREPRQITATPEEENEPVFSPDDQSIFFLRDSGLSADVWKAERGNNKAYWFLNDRFKETRLTQDGEEKQDLQLVPGGKKISFVRGLGDLWVSNHEGGDAKKIVESWNPPSASWSPDGRWLAYSLSDHNFNRDIWIRPIDGSREPFNVSRHPDSDSNPSWSPDGKILAFTGRRVEDETDIYYVWLTREGEQIDKRERALRAAVEKMKQERKTPTAAAPGSTPAAQPKATAKPEPDPKTEPKPDPTADPKPIGTPVKKKNEDDPVASKTGVEPEEKDAEPEKKPEEKPEAKKPEPPSVEIDFEGIYERIHRISIPNSDESGLFWSHDSKRLAFSAEVKGSKGTFMVTFPDKLSAPVGLSPKTGSFARWIAKDKDDTILWLVDGKPSSLTKGVLTQHPIAAQQTLDRRAYRREAFEQVWRAMRDHYYDAELNHQDWDQIAERYTTMAAEAPDDRAFDTIVEMLLGELNGSHLGFSVAAQPAPSVGPWKNETAHLGLSFDRFYAGPGWKITSVLTDGPADRVEIKLKAGDIVTHIDGRELKPDSDSSALLNGRLDRDISLTVVGADDGKGEQGEQERKVPSRTVRIRPISYAAARDLANEERIRATRAEVEELSGGSLGYVYVARMQWDEFLKFEEEIYARGAGRDGLIIDVRDNGGGFTADHLLTVLTAPRHAFTVPRGGGVGYPQDRRVYAAWEKPVVVLCNQNSFSNAEIFAHAIKALGRGKLVGETTAGGVISTGSKSIMDYGVLRMPTRGWFSSEDGTDMELNGAVPHVMVRNLPQDTASGRDRQLEKAVQVLSGEVKAAAKLPRPDAKPASGR